MGDLAKKSDAHLAIEHPEEDCIWLQFENEPILWYKRFQLYLSLGEKRSILRAFRRELYNTTGVETRRYPPDEWYTVADYWCWRERAAAWDSHQSELFRQEAQEALKRAKQKRLAAHELFTEKVLSGLEKTSFEGMPLSQYALAIKTIMEQGRIEFEGAPSGRVDQVNQTTEIKIEFARPIAVTNSRSKVIDLSVDDDIIDLNSEG